MQYKTQESSSDQRIPLRSCHLS